jgi:acetyl esterase/lipase
LSKAFKDLAPPYVFTAELDPLRDEGEVYAGKINAAGSSAKLIRFPGVPNFFTYLDAILDASKRYNQHVIDGLKQYVRK